MEEATKMAKPQTELGDPEEEMVCLFLQEHLLFPLFLQSPKGLHFPGKWDSGGNLPASGR